MSDCDKPTCEASGDRTYRGENGNSLSVCDSCYWELVTGSKPNNASLSPGLPVIQEPQPFEREIELDLSDGDGFPVPGEEVPEIRLEPDGVLLTPAPPEVTGNE